MERAIGRGRLEELLLASGGFKEVPRRILCHGFKVNCKTIM